MAVGSHGIVPLDLQTKSFLGLKFEKAFSGAEVTRWLKLNGFAKDQKTAEKIGSQLLSMKIISHCSSDKLPFTKACYYTFVEPSIVKLLALSQTQS